MRKLSFALLGGAMILATAALADPNPQLVSSIQNRLAHYDLSANVSQVATSSVVQLHFALSSPQGYLKTKRELRAILRNAKYK